jgi:hypothetical protein
MRCRHCGAEIADKALICYRCGTATSEPVFKPAARRRGGPWLVPLIAVVLVALIAWLVAELD